MLEVVKDVVEEKPSCLICRYCFEGDIDKQTLKKQPLCRKNPPVSYPIPTQSGISIMTMHPHVNKSMICAEFIEMARILE